MSWKKVKLGELLTESRVPCDNPNPDRRIKVKLKVLGVEKRGLENEIEGATKQFVRKAGQFIYGKQNFHKGAFGIIPKELDGFESSADLPAFDVSKNCLPEWIFYYFKQGNYYLELSKIARGVATQRIHPEQIYDLEIPLPDLKTQREVINRIDSLEESGKAISTELSHQLTLVKKLRQQLLQDAVQGKLVAPSPLERAGGEADEPASELLKKIKAEKEKLIAEKKLKKEKELPPIKPEEIPFEIPENWMWCRLGAICTKITDGTHHSPTNVQEGEYKYVTAKNIKDYGIDLSDITYVSGEVHKEIYNRCNPEKDDLLYIKDGATTGIVTINNLDEEFSMLSSVALLKVSNILNNKFIVHLMRSPFYYEATRADMYGVAITRVTLEKIKHSFIPLPPLSEQNRIVQKLDELMQYCNELEASIKQSESQNEKLLQQVLREALRKEPVEA